MPGPFIVRDFETFVQLETVWGTSPGALAGADAFKSRTKFAFKRVKARYDRENDMDNAQRSVLSTQGGRESGTWAVDLDVIPGGNAAAPTVPDVDPFLEAHFGTKHLATANTTTAAGSTATSINLAVGGGAASGVQTGDLVAFDVSAVFGIEVRQVTVAGDVLTVDRALSGAPAAARNVYLGTTYSLSAAALKSVYLWQFLNGANFRHAMPGSVVKDLSIDIDFNNVTPVASMKLSGPGQPIITHANARPTPVTIGQPLLPSQGKVWIGPSGVLGVTKVGLKSVSALDLRESESTSLFPTGVKGTANKSRYMISQQLELLLLTGTIDAYFDNANVLTAYDVITQIGITPGQIVAWRTPKFILDGDIGDAGDEVTFSGSGRCYGTTADDEIKLAFL
jgi:hypothetical protein